MPDADIPGNPYIFCISSYITLNIVNVSNKSHQDTRIVSLLYIFDKSFKNPSFLNRVGGR